MSEVHQNTVFGEVAEGENVVLLELLGDDPCQDGLVVGDELVVPHALLLDGPPVGHLLLSLELLEDLQQGAHVVVVDFGEWGVDKAECVEGLVVGGIN